jgi:hypothetical protein
MLRKNALVGGCIHAARICGPFHLHRGAVLASSLVSVMTLAAGASAMPDLKIAVKITVPNHSALGSETINYIQNDRKRVEVRRQYPQSLRPGGPVVFLPAPPIVTITQCDLDQVFVLNLDDREYMSMPVPKPPSRETLQARAAQQPKPATQPQPTLLIETTTNDTGEREEMFGFSARHVITTRKQIPLVESGQTPQETVTDGWYIDLDTAVSCDRAPSGAFTLMSGGTRQRGEPPQIPVPIFKSIGNPERGLALTTKELIRATVSSPDRPTQTIESFTNETHVTELSTEPLDPALFEVPRNFRKVSEIRRYPVVSYWMRLLEWLNYYWARLKRAI